MYRAFMFCVQKCCVVKEESDDEATLSSMRAVKAAAEDAAAITDVRAVLHYLQSVYCLAI